MEHGALAPCKPSTPWLAGTLHKAPSWAHLGVRQVMLEKQQLVVEQQKLAEG